MEAVRPYLLRKGGSVHLFETETSEKIGLAGQREYPEKLQDDRLGNAGFDQFSPDPPVTVGLIHIERPYLGEVLPDNAHGAYALDCCPILMKIDEEIP
jgi:hypothetical protein